MHRNFDCIKITVQIWLRRLDLNQRPSGYEGFTEVFLLFLRLRIALEYAYITSFFKFRITQPTHREQLFWGRDWGQTQGSSKSGCFFILLSVSTSIKESALILLRLTGNCDKLSNESITTGIIVFPLPIKLTNSFLHLPSFIRLLLFDPS